MSETSINATVSGGGAAGVLGARDVHIENLYVGAVTATPPVPGPIPPCPYPGLAYFGPQDAARFFGREQAIQALITAVGKRSFTALVGASGSGKSSVVLAGLVPRLDAQRGWRSSYFRIGTEPDKNPFAAAAGALEPLTGQRTLANRLKEVEELTGTLASGGTSLKGVIAECRRSNPGKRILLIADQFEEAFTLVPDDALRERFINALIEAFPDPPQGSTPDDCLVLTLRADFYSAALRYRPLADRLQDHVENLGPMTRDELREAIVKPAEAVGVEFGPGLVDTILDAVERRPGSLPLLQFALREMWRRLKTPLMTRADYDAIDGVEGALAKRAQTIFADATSNQTDAASVALFRRLFTRLVTLGEGAEDTRRIVGREELGPDAWALAQKLAGEENRLLVMGWPVVGQETAEVAHEALIRNWPALVEWVNGDREFISWRNQLRQRTDDWRRSPSDEGTLLRGGPLAVAEDWVARRGDDLNEEERAFVAASAELRDLVKRREREAVELEDARLAQIAAAQANTGRLQRRARWTLAGFAALVAVLVVFGGGEVYIQRQANLALQQQNNEKSSEIQRDSASLDIKQHQLQHERANLMGELASDELLRGNFDRALRIAALGTRADLALPPESVTASAAAAQLATSVSHSDWGLVLSGHEGSVTSVAFSPDGSRIVTASADNTARIWDVVATREIAVLRGHNQAVTSAAFSPDGSRIVTASGDNTARIWDAASAKEIAVLRGHKSGVNASAFSPDGTRIVTASADNTARIWDAASAKEIAVLRGHEGAVNSAAFSPDGSRIVTASGDTTARIWDAATLKQIAVLRGHGNWVGSAIFNSDGSRIVTTSGDMTARIWDSATTKGIAVLRGHEGMVNSAAFSPDGSRIVTASFDKTVRVWNSTISREIVLLTGHADGVNSAAFSPDGSRIVMTSKDKTARIWDAASAKEIAVLRGHEGSVTSAAFSPDGSRIVTASWDRTARIWDAASAKEIAVLRGHEGAVNSAAFSPDGTRIVTASADNTALIWDAASAKEIAVLRGHEGAVNSAAFSPDGSRVVTASQNWTASIWDCATAREIAVLRGHLNRVMSAAFSPDGTRIVTASWGNTAGIWDVATSQEIAVLQGHQTSVLSAAFSPDGSRIVTASGDQTARIWDAASAKEIAVLRGHQRGVNSAAFSPDGSRIVTASDDMTTRIWDVHFATMSPMGLLNEICRHRLPGLSTMSRDEMRLAGYPDSEPLIDVCAGVAEANP